MSRSLHLCKPYTRHHDPQSRVSPRAQSKIGWGGEKVEGEGAGRGVGWGAASIIIN